MSLLPSSSSACSLIFSASGRQPRVGGRGLLQQTRWLFSASPYGRFAHASLIETLTVMMARLIPKAFINVSGPGKGDGEQQIAANAGMSTRIERALAAFAKGIDPAVKTPFKKRHIFNKN